MVLFPHCTVHSGVIQYGSIQCYHGLLTLGVVVFPRSITYLKNAGSAGNQASVTLRVRLDGEATVTVTAMAMAST